MAAAWHLRKAPTFEEGRQNVAREGENQRVTRKEQMCSSGKIQCAFDGKWNAAALVEMGGKKGKRSHFLPLPKPYQMLPCSFHNNLSFCSITQTQRTHLWQALGSSLCLDKYPVPKFLPKLLFIHKYKASVTPHTQIFTFTFLRSSKYWAPTVNLH